jgi:hypothetical protein
VATHEPEPGGTSVVGRLKGSGGGRIAGHDEAGSAGAGRPEILLCVQCRSGFREVKGKGDEGVHGCIHLS